MTPKRGPDGRFLKADAPEIDLYQSKRYLKLLKAFVWGVFVICAIASVALIVGEG